MGDRIVSGGSDGIVNVWSLSKATLIHRIDTGTNTVTSLAVDHNRILSTCYNRPSDQNEVTTEGIDGKAQVWDLATGELIRELGERSDKALRAQMSESMAGVLRLRDQKTQLEVGEKRLASIFGFTNIKTGLVLRSSVFFAVVVPVRSSLLSR